MEPSTGLDDGPKMSTEEVKGWLKRFLTRYKNVKRADVAAWELAEGEAADVFHIVSRMEKVGFSYWNIIHVDGTPSEGSFGVAFKERCLGLDQRGDDPILVMAGGKSVLEAVTAAAQKALVLAQMREDAKGLRLE